MLAISSIALNSIITVGETAEVEEFYFDPLRTEDIAFSNHADIVQFIDETETTIGRAAAYVTWREIFGSIQDLPSSGTKLLTIESNPDIQRKIVREYNYDVSRIAEEQNADFVLWGVVREVDAGYLLWSHLAVSDNNVGPGLEVQVSLDPEGQYNLTAALPSKQFNFTPVVLSTPNFGTRRWFVRRPGASVFPSPSTDTERIGSLATNIHVDSSNITDKWVRLSDEASSRGFVELWPLDLLPEAVFLRNDIGLWEMPERGSTRLAVVNRSERASVQQQAYVGPTEIKWFEVDVSGQRGWLPAEDVVTGHQLPAGYLLAAMLRYQGKDFAKTIDEVSQFMQDNRENDNAILAFANELRAAASIMRADSSPESLLLARQWLDNAVEQTPYDPAAYRLRALAYATSGGDWNHAISDLLAALRLDRRGAETLTIVDTLISAASDEQVRSRIRPIAGELGIDEILARLEDIRARALPPLEVEGN